MITLLYVGPARKDRFYHEMFKAVRLVDGYEILIKPRYDDSDDVCRENTIMMCMYDPKCKNSRHGTPNKLYLALKLGIPVIGCKNTEVAKFINSYHCGFTCNYDKDSFILLLRYVKGIKNLWGLKIYSTLSKIAYKFNNWEDDKKNIHEIYKYDHRRTM